MADLLTVLSEISSIAIVAGVLLVILQLQQNAKETRTTAAFALLEKLTDESYARRRKNMHDRIKKYSAKKWKGFDDAYQDWESRNFAYLYELIGQLVKQRIIDLNTVTEALKYLVVADWEAFSPLANHLMER
jgi:16S rRNA A1518/A1519 N6-dimethyltransferase RsmA/KsgA/DIM1 with predicted DNA glycosylase/AP lyase activity